LRAEKSRADQENTALRAQHEQQLTKLRASFERESASIRAQADKEAAARQGQVELDILTLKTVHTKELAGKDTRIQQLEATIRELRNEKETMFDQLQLRQGEIESSTSHQESLQGQTNELQYQLREALDREAAIRGEFELLRKRLFMQPTVL
jgi:chromosome segregation ATPase